MGNEFEEVEESEGEASTNENAEQQVIRVRLPRNGEIIGKVVQRLGGNKMDVLCSDGKTRNCRVPGRFKRSMWLRPGDFVIIELWEGDKEKGDVIYQYRGGQVNQLRKKGFLDNIKEGF